MKTQEYIKPIRACIVYMFLIFFLTSCTTTKKENLGDFEPSHLLGMVYDYDNQPCQDTLIIIDDIEETTSDINGKFLINNLSCGDHQITARNDGYETLSFSFQFLNKSQVLYIRMISFHQLLREIENAIENSSWEDVESLIERAEALKKDDPIQQYLKAIYLYEKGNPEDSIQILLDIITKS